MEYDVVRRILTWPGLYPLMGDDFTGPVEEFEVNKDPRIRYVVVDGGATGAWALGLFALVPQNRVCWEVHVAMLPWAKPAEKWAAARALPGWLEKTECRRLVAAVPADNPRAIVYGTHGLGMHCVGRHPKAFMHHGALRDLVLLGRPIG